MMAKAAGISVTLGAAHLAGARPSAAPGPATSSSRNDPDFADKLRRCRRPLRQSARPCRRALGRREEPNPGARSHPARLADEEGPLRHDDPRLQAQRHHHPVRRPQRPRRHGHRPLHAKPPPPGVHPVPQRRSSALSRPARSSMPSLDNYATHKHPKVRQWLADHPRWRLPFHPHLVHPGSMPSKASSPSSPNGASNAASSASIRRSPGRHQPLPRQTNNEPKPFTWTADPDKIIPPSTRHQLLDPRTQPRIPILAAAFRRGVEDGPQRIDVGRTARILSGIGG